jgi:hypothetical protein
MANNCTQCIKFKGQVVLAGGMLRIPPISLYATWLKAPIKMIATRAYIFCPDVLRVALHRWLCAKAHS